MSDWWRRGWLFGRSVNLNATEICRGAAQLPLPTPTPESLGVRVRDRAGIGLWSGPLCKTEMNQKELHGLHCKVVLQLEAPASVESCFYEKAVHALALACAYSCPASLNSSSRLVSSFSFFPLRRFLPPFPGDDTGRDMGCERTKRKKDALRR